MKSTFVGRKDYLGILEKRIRDLKDGYRQNIAIIGDEMVGKTSIIFRFLNKFCDNRIITLYFETRPESTVSFARRFISVLLYNFLSHSAIPLQEDLGFLMRVSSKYIPVTIERINLILEGLDKRKKNNLFGDLLSLCESIYQETSKSCVVIFDEFLNLESLDAKHLYKEWSRLLISQKHTMYIIISSMKYRTKNVLAKDLSLLFGNFEVITIEPFDIPASGEYLEQRLAGVTLEPGLKNFIMHLTGGYPFYLEVVSGALLKSYQNNLSDILEDLLFESSGILHQRFSVYLKRFLDGPLGQGNGAILSLIASGQNRLNDIAHILRRSKKELNLHIGQLMELDAISRSGDFLKVNDRVFAFWLRFVHQNKISSLAFDAKSQKAAFKEQIEKMIQEFMAAAQKPLIDRMAELFRSFSDDTLQLERKRLRLAHFREIKPMELNRAGLREGLIGRSHDSLWIVAFKKDSLTEEDVAEFAKECKKYRHKLQTKVIVTLRDIDANARLRALEEKIWTWDINRLNQIFDLFSKPRVIA
ncbi:MAG TPA: hypothetical protein VMD52_06350 [Patescibacteria group bacterium]|nr:hypothetical protein [Patescibacteria group bacterium]